MVGYFHNDILVSTLLIKNLFYSGIFIQFHITHTGHYNEQTFIFKIISSLRNYLENYREEKKLNHTVPQSIKHNK